MSVATHVLTTSLFVRIRVPRAPLLTGASRRAAAFTELSAAPFDIVVIGGGITGAGVARDAAMRGLRTVLIEGEDFASGTSSRSSRLIHGGVRYLEHGHLHLVFESSRERRTLQRIAPHLVRPLAFTWPVYRGARLPRWKLLAGLTLYDALSLFGNVENHERLSAPEVLEHEPGLQGDGLTGGARYFDASTDDVRLTLANVRSAEVHRAVIVNHAPVVSMREEGGRHRRVVVTDAIAGGQHEILARLVVNAAGPWSESVRALDTGLARGDGVHGSKGAHIAVPRARVGNREAVTMISPSDGRVMFTLPAGDHAIIGTTETSATRGPGEVRASREDVRYLLDAANAYFTAAALGDADVVAAWAGIRPLVARAVHASVNTASREHAIVREQGTLITVTGGKLTTYRAMAEEVVDEVLVALGVPKRACETADHLLPGGEADDIVGTEQAAAHQTHDREVAARLVRAYGVGWGDVWSYVAAQPQLARRISDEHPYVMAELVHAVEHEHAATLGDLLVRRVPLAFETSDHALSVATEAAREIAPLLGWTEERQRAEVDQFEREINRLFAIDA